LEGILAGEGMALVEAISIAIENVVAPISDTRIQKKTRGVVRVTDGTLG
jgi:hypothetical protein